MHRVAVFGILGIIWASLGVAAPESLGDVRSGATFFSCRFHGAETAYRKCDAEARIYWDLVGQRQGPSTNPPNRLQVVCDQDSLYDDSAHAVVADDHLRISGLNSESDAGGTAIILPSGPIGSELLAQGNENLNSALTTSWLETKRGELRGFCEVRRGQME